VPDAGERLVEPVSVVVAAAAPAGSGAQAEALSALTNLGYSPGEAAGAVAQVSGDQPGLQTADMIRAALKVLAPKG
jgi:Holliday junction DNA helicase RuvA